jgi:hypothetical protein
VRAPILREHPKIMGARPHLVGGLVISSFSSCSYELMTFRSARGDTPPPLQSGLKLVCNVNIVHGNLKSENSRDYAQKPQRNFYVHELGFWP